MEKNDVLRRALAPAEGEPKRLPSNFAYTTMNRIRREQREAEQRQRVIALVCIAGVTLLGLCTVGYFFGRAFLDWLRDAFSHSADLSLVPATLFCLIFFALLNGWLLRHYHTDRTSC